MGESEVTEIIFSLEAICEELRSGSIFMAPHSFIDATSLFAAGWNSTKVYIFANEALMDPAIVVVADAVNGGRVTKLDSSAENTYECQFFVNSGERVLISLATQGIVLVSISLSAVKVTRGSAIVKSSIGIVRSEGGLERLREVARTSRSIHSVVELRDLSVRLKAEIAPKVKDLGSRELFDGQLDGDLIHLLELKSADSIWTKVLAFISIGDIFDDSWRRTLGSIITLIGVSEVSLLISGQKIPLDEAVKFSQRMSNLYSVTVSFEVAKRDRNLIGTAVVVCSTPREYRPDCLYVAARQLGEGSVAVNAPSLVRDVTGAVVTLLTPPSFQMHLALASPIFAESAIFDADRLAKEKFDSSRALIDASVTDIYFAIAHLQGELIDISEEPIAIFESTSNRSLYRFSSLFDNDRYLELLSSDEPTVTHSISDEAGFKVIRRTTKASPSVTVILPMRDRADLTRNCIDSISLNCTYENYRIVVVDNGSIEEESTEFFKDLDKEGIVVISYPNEFNFAAISNYAVDHIQSDYVLLLNNDIEVRGGDFIAEMVALSTLSQVGIVGQRLIYSDSDIQHCGVRLGVGEAMAEHFQMLVGQPDFGQYLVPAQFSAVTGAALMIAKSSYLEVGGMDATHLKISYNDIDLCLKVAESGKLIVNNPFSEVVHFESKSRGIDGISLDKIKRNANERAYMVARWDEAFSKDSLWPTI